MGFMNPRTAESIALGCTIAALLGLLYILTKILIHGQVMFIEPNTWILIFEIIAVAYATYYNIKKAIFS